ncbi:hypothetical protein H4S02_003855 [Coemansia sp. RSA 2611]|nr:hypothetical protein LPJ70_003079 [Coemansia sp. RSA 2708]KAJ2307096.1 hypothetical protein IWW54_004511 [Coemansia sp. RSA 2705]KAJ2317297.1 hypothetical protein IWW52_003200 [Coemansia sp. RSA 2704]KAJ2364772.1 hypothetical protein H4S01_003600 [Coemansia sp. RSA 2610]KAJ2386439.1 hypothetical protein H4S02_003855 [Coemansia sp. RSA 2611]
MSKTIAIVGATGLQGHSVLKTLYASNEYRIRALSRNIGSDRVKALAVQYPNVEWAEADIDNIESLRKAFDSVDIVFGMTDFGPSVISRMRNGEVEVEYTQGKNIVDAAIDAGAKTLIFSVLDSLAKQSNGKYPGATQFESKYKVGQYLLSKSDGIDGFTICLGCYMDNFIRAARISPDDEQTVEFRFPYKPTNKVPLVDTVNDTGPVVKYILDHPDETRGACQDVSGGFYEMQEMVRAFTEVTGKPARYVQIADEEIPIKEVIQMFNCLEEFGPFCNRTAFLERNKQMEHKFTTPVDYWKNSKWTGPVKQAH